MIRDVRREDRSGGHPASARFLRRPARTPTGFWRWVTSQPTARGSRPGARSWTEKREHPLGGRDREREIATQNDTENAGMLALNAELGYRLRLVRAELVRET